MTTYTVASMSDGEATAMDTADREEALDWFTNGVEAVVDGRSPVTFCSIAIDGKVWGEIVKGGLAQRPPGGDGGGEVIDLPMRRVG